MKYLALIFFLQWISSEMGYCQNTSEVCTCDSFNLSSFETKLKGELFISTIQVSGSQYYNDWEEADVKLSTGEIVHGQKIRYNGFLNELMWLVPVSYKTVILDKSDIKEVHFKKSQRVLRNVKIAGVPDSTVIFAEILYENHISLFVYRKIIQESPELMEKNGSAYTISTLKNSPIYYLKLPGNRDLLSFSRINKRNVLSLLNDKKNDAKKALKENHISIGNEFNLIKAIQLLDSKI